MAVQKLRKILLLATQFFVPSPISVSGKASLLNHLELDRRAFLKYMILRLGLAISLSVAAYALTQNRSRISKQTPSKEEITEEVNGDSRNHATANNENSYNTEACSAEGICAEQIKHVDRTRSWLRSNCMGNDDFPLPEFGDLASRKMVEIMEEGNESAAVTGRKDNVKESPSREETCVSNESILSSSREKPCISNEPISRGHSVEDSSSREEPCLSSESILSSAREKPCISNESISEQCISNQSIPKADDVIESLKEQIERLKQRVRELELEMLEYYCLSEQQKNVDELVSELRVKGDVIELLNERLNSLETNKKELQSQLSEAAIAKVELDSARKRINELQAEVEAEAMQKDAEFAALRQRLISLEVKEEAASKRRSESENNLKILEELEIERLELTRINKELQREKRELKVQLDTAEAQISDFEHIKRELVENAAEEVRSLKTVNDELSKQLETLRNNQLEEVEELVYLRWINACLRHELRNYQPPLGKVSARDLSKTLSPKSKAIAKHLLLEYATSDIAFLHKGSSDTSSNAGFRSPPFSGSHASDNSSFATASTSCTKLKKSTWMHILKPWKKSKAESAISSKLPKHKKETKPLTEPNTSPLNHWDSSSQSEIQPFTSFFDDTHLVCASKENVSGRRQRAKSTTFFETSGHMLTMTDVAGKENEHFPNAFAITHGLSVDDWSKFQPMPKSASSPYMRDDLTLEERQKLALERKNARSKKVIEADFRKTSSRESDLHNARLLSEKEDSTELNKGDRIQSLAKTINSAVFLDMNDVVNFVHHLDMEISCLIEDFAELKHFDWPEGKVDTLREAAFEYLHLQMLESEVSSFVDDSKVTWDDAHNRMYLLLELIEENVYGLLQTHDIVMTHYKGFDIPTDWLQDSGLIGKLKLACVRLAKKYMERVGAEFDAVAHIPEKDPVKEFLLLQGVRFAYRAHQLAGGFDMKTMQVFEDLRKRARQCVHDADESAD